jgi:CheY-like chemotaxis protein
MNLFNSFDPQASTVVGFGIRTLLISTEALDGSLARKLAGLGCRVEDCDELYLALDQVMDGPQGYDLIVVDCDTTGGLDQGKRAHALLKATGRCIPVILVSSECQTQNFPFNRFEPTVLRAPLSAISLRVGFEHAMQERLLMARAS